tara:strand:- start:4907 stop:5917 length:1011 start_codon:yes stop_codon:yes gene_type:complete
MLIFAAETSCDETSICLMENSKIIEHVIFSQGIHNNYGGVVPELASRSHLQILQNLTYDLFEKNTINPRKIDVFAATCGPGLIGSLLVGSTFIKSLSLGYKKPFMPINHLEGHILSTSFNNKIVYPHIVLLLTGGHTQIYLMNNEKEIKLLGQTVDDALGEAFDKTAKLLGLNYPGGVEIENCAKYGDENSYSLPKPMFDTKDFNFSFSGIKTYINLLVKKNKIEKNFINNLSASFQKTVSDLLIKKIDNGLKLLQSENINIKSISVVGGVANNEYIKNKMEQFFVKNEIKIYYPIKEMMGDNAAMIAWACFKNYSEEKVNLHFKADPRMKIDNFF